MPVFKFSVSSDAQVDCLVRPFFLDDSRDSAISLTNPAVHVSPEVATLAREVLPSHKISENPILIQRRVLDKGIKNPENAGVLAIDHGERRDPSPRLQPFVSRTRTGV